jgi:hypothetical protein
MGAKLRTTLYTLVALAAATIVAVPFLEGVIEPLLIIKISRIATAFGILLASMLHIPFQLPPANTPPSTGGPN